MSLSILSFVIACACGDGAKESPSGVDAGSTVVDASQDASQSADADSGPKADAAPELMAVKIAFQAYVGDEPWSCDRIYTGLGTTTMDVQPRDLRVFVQDVALVRASDGKLVPLQLEPYEGFQTAEVALLDFESNDGTCIGAGGTAATHTVLTGFAPKAVYRGIAFTNGVPESLNHRNPIELTAPLVPGPLHWNWNGGFLFFNAQMQEVLTLEPDGGQQLADAGAASADSGADAGSEISRGAVVVHIGSTQCAPTSSGHACGRPNRNRVLLEPFDPTRDTIVLDVAPLFTHLDLHQTVTCHAVGIHCAGFFPALGLNYDIGEPATTQSIYRVE